MPRAKWQDIDGVLLLDKPVGLSSNDALQKARRLFRARKAGHGGTLDPLASGLLPIAFGQATKFLNDVIDAGKVYLADVALGFTSDTGDGEGQLQASDESGRVATLTPGDIENALATLRGDIDQVPPMYSALKHQGKPLYEYARAGKSVERPPRRVHISELALTQNFHAGMTELSLRVACSKGTYIRVLAEDIGRALGCGAYLKGLRRVAVGSFSVDDAVTLEQLAQWADNEPARLATLRPLDAMVSGLPACIVAANRIERFCQGQSVPLDEVRWPAAGDAGSPDALPEIDRIRVYGERGEGGDASPRFLGMAQLIDHHVAPKRLVVS